MSAYLVEITYSVLTFADSQEEASNKALEQFNAGAVDQDRELSETAVDTSGVLELPSIDTLTCHRCHGPVEWSRVPGYTYYCPECDEDLYTFEVRRKKNGKDNDQD